MKKWLWLIPLAVFLLVAYIMIESPLEDKRYNNPIGENVVALEFRLTDGNASVCLNDQEAIDRLRNAHRWTNYHMYCCLVPDEVYAYVYEVTDGTRNPAEPMKLYNSWDIPSFNLGFRLLLRKYCDELLERT